MNATLILPTDVWLIVIFAVLAVSLIFQVVNATVDMEQQRQIRDLAEVDDVLIEEALED